MQSSSLLLLVATLATLTIGSSSAFAASHIRGQISALEGDEATVTTTSGDTVEVTLKPDFGMVVYHRITLDDLKPGDYLSIPSITAADGRKQAVALSVFPAALKGAGEGESPWDHGEGSMMTNATFGTMAAQGADHCIVVSYKGTEETIEVPQGTPIMAFGPDPHRKLQVGDNVFIFATDTDGKLVAGRAGVMDDGTPPPL